MKQKVLIPHAIFPEVVDRLRQHFDVEYHAVESVLSPAKLAERLADKAGALTFIIHPINATTLALATQLKVVCNVAVGYNNFDMVAINAAKIMATNTPRVLDDTTADTTWALILASARRIVAADQWVRQGQWQGWKFLDSWLGDDVHHATLGVLGMGRIGQAVAERAAGFSMRVIYHKRRRLSQDTEAACRATWVDKATLLRESDFLVLLVPYSPETHHIIGAKELQRMKPSSHLINISRGGVVDDAALIDALKQKRIAGAGMDVFENEPNLNPEFLTLNNVTLTPHIGSATRATRLAMANLAADNLIAALSGLQPPNLINPG